MENQFVPYEIAKELKDLGFDMECFSYWYTTKGENPQIHKKDLSFGFKNGKDTNTVAPLYQQAFKFFRDKYDLSCYVSKDENKDLSYKGITYGYDISNGNYGYGFTSFEEAELNCLNSLLKIVKTI